MSVPFHCIYSTVLQLLIRYPKRQQSGVYEIFVSSLIPRCWSLQYIYKGFLKEIEVSSLFWKLTKVTCSPMPPIGTLTGERCLSQLVPCRLGSIQCLVSGADLLWWGWDFCHPACHSGLVSPSIQISHIQAMSPICVFCIHLLSLVLCKVYKLFGQGQS